MRIEYERDKKFMELPPHHRQVLVAEVIDAMVYHREAVAEVTALLDSFRERGFLHSVILPDSQTIKQ